jgi:hypothetical protein
MQIRTGRKANLIGHILCRNIIKQTKEGRIEMIGRQVISNYWMTFKRRKDTGN